MELMKEETEDQKERTQPVMEGQASFEKLGRYCQHDEEGCKKGLDADRNLIESGEDIGLDDLVAHLAEVAK